MGNFNPDRIPDANHMRKGLGRSARSRWQTMSAPHRGGAFEPGTKIETLIPVVHRGWRAGQPGHLADPRGFSLSDYPLLEIGNLRMNGNFTDRHTEIEQRRIPR
jgi:hypothetical protein